MATSGEDGGRVAGRSRGRVRSQITPPITPARRPYDDTTPQNNMQPWMPVLPPGLAGAPPAPGPQGDSHLDASMSGLRITDKSSRSESGTSTSGELFYSSGSVSLTQSSSAEEGGGDGTDFVGMGRGARRGRRDELAILATRPAHVTDKRGSSGQTIQLVANYFRLHSIPQYCVHQYHVDFIPSVESSRMRRAMIADHRDVFGKCFVFDGMSDLKTPTLLTDEVVELQSQRRSDGASVIIRIRRVQELAPNNPDLLRLFNTQMRRNLEHLEFIQINRHYFDKRAVSAIPQHGLELWQGLVTAIGQHETGVMMVTDTIHKVLRRDSVLDLLVQIGQEGRGNYKEEAIKRVTGAIVMTPYNNKTYRVDDIDWAQNPRCSFETREGLKTYMQYYKSQYEIDIRDPNQPLLVCRPKEKDIRAGRSQNIYLIPELCVMTGLTDEMRANVNVMRDLAQHTRVEPPRRVRNLLEFIKRVNSDRKVAMEMQQWGLQISNQLVDIKARVVYPEKIHQRMASYTYNPKTADFSKEMRDKQMHVAANLDKWMVICHNRDTKNCADFIRSLMTVCPPMGVEVSVPKQLEIDDDRAGHFVRVIQQFATPDTRLAVAILPNNRKDRYDIIKKQACVEMGLQTQVMLSRTISNKKNLRSVATKVAVQLNCKLGGEAWCLEIPLSKTMVIGYDTYHDSSQRGRSAGAFVASLNKTFTRWYSRVSFHHTHMELGNALATHLCVALKEYQRANYEMPDRILFFRDGVSDGQIPQVREWEINQIVGALDGMFPGAIHKLAFVVVTKRISTRFFAASGDSETFTNPPPGTVVDTEVTRPERYDFFLVSQSVRQGTVAPTHYNVIYDTTGLKPDHMQRLAYKLTHLYFNWPGTIRVPAPCQYAHKLAFLAGQSLHAEPNNRLATTLFYL